MPRILSPLGNSWMFARKQPAILQIGFWFVFLPILIAAQFERAMERIPFFQLMSHEALIVSILSITVLVLIGLWGNICVLFVGKRLLQTKAGRSRTSFKAVRSQAKPLYIPYVLTIILQNIFTILWTLLLIIPGIIYMIRTIFFSVIIATEGLSYRAALNRSKQIVKGQFWPVCGALVLLFIVIFVPVILIDGITTAMSEGAPYAILLAADIISSAANSVASILFLLTLIQLYGYFRPVKHAKN